MAKNSRTRKIRRRLRMTLNHGHEVRHKLRSGRTGKVHSVKMRSPKKSKSTGEIELLIPGTNFPTPQQIIDIQSVEPIPQPIRRRRRPIDVVQEVSAETVEPEIVTSVDAGTEGYSYVLRAIERLSINNEMLGSRENHLLNALLKAIDQYEKK